MKYILRVALTSILMCASLKAQQHSPQQTSLCPINLCSSKAHGQFLPLFRRTPHTLAAQLDLAQAKDLKDGVIGPKGQHIEETLTTFKTASWMSWGPWKKKQLYGISQLSIGGVLSLGGGFLLMGGWKLLTSIGTEQIKKEEEGAALFGACCLFGLGTPLVWSGASSVWSGASKWYRNSGSRYRGRLIEKHETWQKASSWIDVVIQHKEADSTGMKGESEK